jgi:aldehyde dehydrogenase (NAD+)/gamma-glutamyl-gamma-aminobutyraldehyde dehydrogenase
MTEAKTAEFYRRKAGAVQIPGRAFIDGKYCPAISGAVFENINPATGEAFGTVASCDAADVDLAVAAGRRAFEAGSWARAAPETRKQVLLRLADLVRAHAEELAILESLDSGKTIRDCLHEIGNEVPTFFQWYAELIDKTFGKVAATAESTVALIVKEPIGVVGLVLPWNFPLLMAAWKLAPALAAGCSAVLKPAEQTPLTALRLAELAMEAGVPAGVLNVVPGFGETAGQAIGRHMDIDAVSFTGSTEVGACFLKYSSESNLKPVGLEMGGKSPFIVLDDAPIDDDLVNFAVTAAFWNGGQNCSANMRQIVDRKVRDTFLDKVLARVKTIRLGDPLDPATDLGSMVSLEHQSRVLSYIERGAREGARVALAGGKVSDRPGFFVAPTIFDEVRPEMVVAREEIFGPVLGLITVTGVDEAIKVARDTQYGLHASVFTRDIGKAFKVARALPCGTVSVNAFSEGDVKTPFGGYKRSGSLARDNGTEAVDQYTQTKSIWINVGA